MNDWDPESKEDQTGAKGEASPAPEVRPSVPPPLAPNLSESIPPRPPTPASAPAPGATTPAPASSNADGFNVQSRGVRHSDPSEVPKRSAITYVKWAISGILVFGALGIAVLAVRHFLHSDELEEAVHVAGDDGRAASIRAALEWIGGHDILQGDAALRSRLQAMAALAGELDIDLEELASDIEDLSDSSEKKIAATYLALLQGDAEGAQAVAADLTPVLPYAAESARARAMAAFAVGDLTTAVALSSRAVADRPGAPRHAALFAVVKARNRDVDGGLAVLEGVSGSPAAEAARARILVEARRDRAGAEAAAAAVLAAGDATAAEKAWAHMVRGRLAAEDGLRDAALAEAELATAEAPPGNEAFALGMAELFLRAGKVQRAAQVTRDLDGDVSIDLERRERVRAWLILAQGNVDAAADALMDAPSNPPTAMVRAELHAERGEKDAARAQYRLAAEDEWLAARALSRLATLELDDGNEREALRLATEALAKAPNHPEIIPVAVRAHVENDEADAAMALAEAALAVHGEDARVMAAKAVAQMAKEQWQEALTTLRAAVERDSTDPEVLADRGEAARMVGEDDEARQSFEAALAIQPHNGTALVGLFALDIEAMALEAAGQTLAKIDEASVRSHRVDQLRARYLVLTGAGQAGVSTILAATRRHRRDGALALDLAELYLQAGNYNRAISTFDAAARYGADRRTAIAGKALAYMLSNRGRMGLQQLERARSATPEGEEVAASPRELVVEGRGELMQDHERQATNFARRALEIASDDSHAHYLLAEVAIADENDEEAATELRAAANGRNPLPLAAQRLALILGPTEEGCALARRAVENLPRGTSRRSRDLVRGCN